jgi:hypothetical protein
MGNTWRIIGILVSMGGIGATLYAARDYIFQDLSAKVSGTWAFDLELAETSVPAYRGMRMRYFVNLQQNGLALAGEGEKICQNGESIPGPARTRLEVIAGKVEGQTVSIAFRDFGKIRQSNGTFKLTASGDRMSGHFVWTAANAAGPMAAMRTDRAECR